MRVPAKLNLQLAVGPPRADGYHDLVTVFHAISLFDEVTVTPADRVRVEVTGEGADQVPADDGNLAVRAALALADAAGRPHPDSRGVTIERAAELERAAAERVVARLAVEVRDGTIGRCRSCGRSCPPWFPLCDRCARSRRR